MTDIDPRIVENAHETARDPRVDAIVLFGSHARSTGTPASDVDLCVLGAPGGKRAADALYEEISRFTPADVLWSTLDELGDQARMGTVWADIVTEGRVIAGVPDILRNMTVGRMKIEMIARSYGATSIRAATQTILDLAAAQRTRRAEIEAGTSPDARSLRDEYDAWMGAASHSSIELAEHVARAIAGIVGAKTTRSHNLEQAGEAIARLPDAKQDAPARTLGEQTLRTQLAGPLRDLGDRISALNGDTPILRAYVYIGQTEPSELVARRTIAAISLHGEIALGLLANEGPLKWLRRFASADRRERSRELRAANLKRSKSGVPPLKAEEFIEDTAERAMLIARRARSSWDRACKEIRDHGDPRTADRMQAAGDEWFAQCEKALETAFTRKNARRTKSPTGQ